MSAPQVDVSQLVFVPNSTKATLTVGGKTETYDYLDTPDPNSSLVVAAKASYDNYLNLAAVLRRLDLTIDLIYLGYNAAIGTEKISSILSESQIQLLVVCHEARTKFNIISDNVGAVEDRILDALYYLSLLKEQSATKKFSRCATNFQAIMEACDEYRESITKFLDCIRKGTKDVEIHIGEDEKNLTTLAQLQAGYDANANAEKEAAESLKQTLDSENKRIKQAYDDYNAAVQQKNKFLADSQKVEIGTRVCEGIFTLGISEAVRAGNHNNTRPDTKVFDAAIERNRQVIQELLDAKQKHAQARLAALKNMKKDQAMASQYIEEENMIKAAERCMEITKHACNMVNNNLNDDRGFWQQVKRFCDTLHDACDAFSDTTDAHTDDTAKERRVFYKSEKFKKQCIKSIVSWQAVSELCQEYADEFGKYIERINSNINACPTLAQAQGHLKILNKTVMEKVDRDTDKADKLLQDLQKKVDKIKAEYNN